MKSFRLLVTFDIPGAKGGDKRYKRVDDYLDSIGTVVRVFKQVRLVTTRDDPRTIAPTITKIVGPKSLVLVAHVAKPFRFVVGNQSDKADLRGRVTNWMRGAK